MVAHSDILAHNEALKSLSNPVAVFVGATQGIGLSTLKAFVRHTTSPTAYCVGRSNDTLNNIIKDLKILNSTGTYVAIQCSDLTLLSNVDTACSLITEKITNSAHKKVDYLFLSAGFLSFGGRTETNEGLDAVMSIQYYSRMRFTYNLLPLLRQSSASRVVSVLAGGKEGSLFLDDLSLKTHYSFGNVTQATPTMTTLSMEQLAKDLENKQVSFVQLFPGIVAGTGLLQNPKYFGVVVRFLLGWIVMPIANVLVGISVEEAGERVLYAGTVDKFGREGGAALAKGSDGEVGSGVYSLSEKSDTAPSSAVLAKLRDQQAGDKIWGHTMAEFDRIEKKQL